MTITIPEYWLWIGLAMMAVTIVLSAAQAILTRKLAAANKAKAEADWEVAKSVMEVSSACLKATEAMNAETGSRWMRIKDVKHIDIKSKVIATSGDGSGNDVIKFKNGVTVVASGAGRRTLMD